jgi:hypothetical protein
MDHWSVHNRWVVTIVVSGPQATGKTTLAMALGHALPAPVFSRDPLMTVLSQRPFRRRRSRSVASAGLRLQTALLARQLELGQPAILECIAPTALREQWREMTQAAGQRFVLVECVCGDRDAHRDRVEQRCVRRPRRAWHRVQATMRRYQPYPHPDVLADAMRPLPDLLAEVLAQCRPAIDDI